ncbi:hypothetical protein BJX63DRAFT_82962 [Aspergillus granulosus]|uniref:Uncharacterized protein n=1 Tax=Aspergillus granulosus TaxID=176169 RepID=A0ABR4HRS6_9EURO
MNNERQSQAVTGHDTSVSNSHAHMPSPRLPSYLSSVEPKIACHKHRPGFPPVKIPPIMLPGILRLGRRRTPETQRPKSGFSGLSGMLIVINRNPYKGAILDAARLLLLSVSPPSTLTPVSEPGDICDATDRQGLWYTENCTPNCDRLIAWG